MLNQLDWVLILITLVMIMALIFATKTSFRNSSRITY